MQERRRKGKRRWGLAIGFPLIDSAGNSIDTDRRALPDRRQNTALEERLMLSTVKPRLDSEDKNELRIATEGTEENNFTQRRREN